MFVRLRGPIRSRSRRALDRLAASSDGDLLDVIRESCPFPRLSRCGREARAFCVCRRANRAHPNAHPHARPRPIARGRAAPDRHIAADPPETLVEPTCATAASRPSDARALRFHPRCYYRPYDSSSTETRPVDDRHRHRSFRVITGAHRTGLRPDGFGKAPVDTPRRAMGLSPRPCRPLWRGRRHVLALGGRHRDDVVAALCAACSCRWPAAPLGQPSSPPVLLPPTLRRRLYIACDADARRRRARGIELDAPRLRALRRLPCLRDGDSNEDLRQLRIDALRAAIRVQIAAQDVARFMALAE